MKEEYVKKAKQIVEDLNRDLFKLTIEPSNKEVIKGMLLKSHQLEGISLQADQSLIAYLASKMNFLLTGIAKESSVEQRERLTYLSDFLYSIEHALGYASGKKKYRTSVELFNDLDKMITKKYLKKGEYV